MVVIIITVTKICCLVAEKNKAAIGTGTNQSKRVTGFSSWFNSAKSQADGFKFCSVRPLTSLLLYVLSSSLLTIPNQLSSFNRLSPQVLRPSHITQFYIKENENRSQETEFINNDKIENPVQRNLWCQSSYEGLGVLIKGKHFDSIYQVQIKPSILRIEREKERCSQTI